MRRRKLRPYVLPTFLVIGIVSMMLGVAMLQKTLLPEQEELPTSYVTNTIFVVSLITGCSSSKIVFVT